jgi:hypothetical protein
MATVKDINDKPVEVKVGDWVGFKSDYEQSGQIVEIRHSRAMAGGYEFVLENKNGFGGEYLRYATRTTVHASDCWV